MVRAFSIQVCRRKARIKREAGAFDPNNPGAAPATVIDRDPSDRRPLNSHCVSTREGERDERREPGDRPERIRLVLRRAAPSSAAARIFRIPRLFLPSSKVL